MPMPTIPRSTFIYAAASITFALIRPGLARLIVFGMLVIGAALAFWSTQREDLFIGYVHQVVEEPGAGTFISASPLTTTNQLPVYIPPSDAEAPPPALQDVVLMIGSTVPIPPSPRLMLDEAFVANQIGVIRYSIVIETVKVAIDDVLEHTSDAGLVLAAIVLVVLARLALQLGLGMMFFPVAMLTIGMFLHLNAWEWALIPIPTTMVEPLTWCGGVIGGVLAFKATLRDPLLIGVRLSAALTAIPVSHLLATSGLLPEILTYTLPVIALAWPILIPVLAATILLRNGLDLEVLHSWGAFLGLLVLRWPVLKQTAMMTSSPDGQPATEQTFQPDDRGQINLGQILNNRREQ